MLLQLSQSLLTVPMGLGSSASGPGSGDSWLMEDGTSFWLMEDGTSFWLMG